jgi:hypothetical protein
MFCPIIYSFSRFHVHQWNLPKPSLFSFTVFLVLWISGEGVKFHMFTNTIIISVKVANVLRYVDEIVACGWTCHFFLLLYLRQREKGFHEGGRNCVDALYHTNFQLVTTFETFLFILTFSPLYIWVSWFTTAECGFFLPTTYYLWVYKLWYARYTIVVQFFLFKEFLVLVILTL